MIPVWYRMLSYQNLNNEGKHHPKKNEKVMGQKHIALVNYIL
jgi:hypothetical protein